MKSLFLLVALCLAWTLVSHARDQLQEPVQIGTRSSLGIGGTWQPKNADSRTIRLMEQEIRVALPSRRVEVRSVFRNEGTSDTVEMRFLERGEANTIGPFPPRGYLRDFRSFVDERRLKITRFVPDDGFAEADEEYRVFWVAHVPFKRGQTRIIRDTFIAGPMTEMIGAPECGYRQRFEFDSSGAAYWKGRVPLQRVIFDVQGLRDVSELKFSPPARNKGATFEWQRRDVKPLNGFEVSWWPGIRHFQVDGQFPLQRCIVLRQGTGKNGLGQIYPREIGGKIWVPIRLLQQWLPPSRDGFSNDVAQAALPTYVGLNWGERNVTAVTGERELEATEGGKTLGRYKMNAPAFIENGVTMVELLPAVQAVGGRVTTQNGIVKLWFRERPR